MIWLRTRLGNFVMPTYHRSLGTRVGRLRVWIALRVLPVEAF